METCVCWSGLVRRSAATLQRGATGGVHDRWPPAGLVVLGADLGADSKGRRHALAAQKSPHARWRTQSTSSQPQDRQRGTDGDGGGGLDPTDAHLRRTEGLPAALRPQGRRRHDKRGAGRRPDAAAPRRGTGARPGLRIPGSRTQSGWLRPGICAAVDHAGGDAVGRTDQHHVPLPNARRGVDPMGAAHLGAPQRPCYRLLDPVLQKGPLFDTFSSLGELNLRVSNVDVECKCKKKLLFNL